MQKMIEKDGRDFSIFDFRVFFRSVFLLFPLLYLSFLFSIFNMFFSSPPTYLHLSIIFTLFCFLVIVQKWFDKLRLDRFSHEFLGGWRVERAGERKGEGRGGGGGIFGRHLIDLLSKF